MFSLRIGGVITLPAEGALRQHIFMEHDQSQPSHLDAPDAPARVSRVRAAEANTSLTSNLLQPSSRKASNMLWLI